jgi:hypothetical protein
MLYSKIIAVCSQIHTKHTNTLRGQHVELLNVKPGGTYSDHKFLKRNEFELHKHTQQRLRGKGLAGFEPTGQWFQVLERVTATVT